MKNPYQLQDERKAWRKKLIWLLIVVVIMRLLSGIAYGVTLTGHNLKENIQNDIYDTFSSVMLFVYDIFSYVMLFVGLVLFPIVSDIISLVYPVLFAKKYPLYENEEKPILKKFFAGCRWMICFLVCGFLAFSIGVYFS